MNAEILTIGTELLLGQIVDTNAAWLAQELSKLGLNVFRKTTVGDNSRRIAAALDEGMSRSTVIITSGGLGPTVDDKTREAVALATGRELVLEETLLAGLEAMFQQRSWPLGEGQRRQAYIPAGAVPLPNPVGTAPCFAVEHDGHWIISLPGVPRELKYMFGEVVAPFLRDKLDLRLRIESRILRTVGIGEGTLGDLIQDLMEQDNPTVGTMAHEGRVDLRLVASGEDAIEIQRLLDAAEATIRQRVGRFIYGAGDETLAGVVAHELQERGLTIGVVETNTGGRLAQSLLESAAGERVLRGGLIVGGDAWRAPLSGIEERPFEAETELAIRLAEQARRQFGADLGLALVSSTRANLSRFASDPGTTAIALLIGEHCYTRGEAAGGTNEVVMRLLCTTALNFVLHTMRNERLSG